MTLKQHIKRMPILGPTATTLWQATRPLRFRLARFHSPDYWDSRYLQGGNSGAGSYGELAAFKAVILNDFVQQHRIDSVIEFGCGDGNQLALSTYPAYVGVDISPAAIQLCQDRFRNDSSKKFLLYDSGKDLTQADLALSLDVIYHLVEDDIFERYMGSLFAAARRFVIIYSDNQEAVREALHVRHRKFSDWVDENQPGWRLAQHILNDFPYDPATQTGSWSDFWIYEKTQAPS